MAATELNNRMRELVKVVRAAELRLSDEALGIAEADILSVIPNVLHETMEVRIRNESHVTADSMEFGVIFTPKNTADDMEVKVSFQQTVGFVLDQGTLQNSEFDDADTMSVHGLPRKPWAGSCSLNNAFEKPGFLREVCKLPTEVIRALEMVQWALRGLGAYWAGQSEHSTTEEIFRAAEQHKPTIVIKRQRSRTVEEVYWETEEEQPLVKRARSKE